MIWAPLSVNGRDARLVIVQDVTEKVKRQTEQRQEEVGRLLLGRVLQIGKESGLQIGNIFHAGDGNLHPLVLFDPRDRSQFERAVKAAEDIVRYCVEIGGSLTGEHGVGMEKSELMTLIFSDSDFALMRRVHSQFNPTGLLNPGKVFPMGKGCGETRIRTSPMHSPVLA